MTDQIIEFKTAKKKGFDIPWGINNRRGVFDAYREDGKLGSCVLSDGLYDIQAPTQSLLQKWLREKHNIIIFLGPTTTVGKYAVEVDTIEEHYHSETLIYDTYELALEKGLKEGLKLIKNEKSNN